MKESNKIHWLIYVGQGIFILGLFMPLISIAIIKLSIVDIWHVSHISIKLWVAGMVILGLLAGFSIFRNKTTLATIFSTTQTLLLSAFFLRTLFIFGEMQKGLSKIGKGQENIFTEFLTDLISYAIKPSLSYGWLFLLGGSGLSTAVSLLLLLRETDSAERARQEVKEVFDRLGIRNMTSAVVSVILIVLFSVLSVGIYKGLQGRKDKRIAETVLEEQGRHIEQMVNLIYLDNIAQLKGVIEKEAETKNKEAVTSIKNQELESELNKTTEAYASSMQAWGDAISTLDDHDSQVGLLSEFYLNLLQERIAKAQQETARYIELRNKLIDKYRLNSGKLPEDLPSRMAETIIK